MMSQVIDFKLTRTTSATPEAVFDALTDHASYAAMTPLRSSELIRPGEPAPNGVGAQRKLGLVGPPLVEEVTEYVRPSRFAYRLVSGLPVRNHTGVVEITGLPEGSRVDYHVQSTPSLPGLGLVMGPIVKQAIKGLLDGVIKAAEKR